jgi:hypothetical protein
MEPSATTQAVVTTLSNALGGRPNPTLEQKVDLLLQGLNTTLGQKVDSILQRLDTPVAYPTGSTPVSSGSSPRVSFADQTTSSGIPSGSIAVSSSVSYVAATRRGILKDTAKNRSSTSQLSTGHKGPRDEHIVAHLDKDQPTPDLNTYELWNKLNTALQHIGPNLIASVRLSANQNIVITTKCPTETILAEKDTLVQALQEYPVTRIDKSEAWIRLVAHNVPLHPFLLQDGALDTTRLSDMITTYNSGIQVKGTPRWLKKPDPDCQTAGSVVLSVATEAEKSECLENGLFIAGVKARISVYRTFSAKTHCHRCQGYGHDPRTCRRPVTCRLCAGKHHTRDHTCPICHEKTCNHRRCAHCNQEHAAGSVECESHSVLQ